MVVNSNHPIKALWNPPLHPLASEVQWSRCSLHRADREWVKVMHVVFFSDNALLSTELLLVAVTSLCWRDSGSISWAFPSHRLTNRTVSLLWSVSVTFWDLRPEFDYQLCLMEVAEEDLWSNISLYLILQECCKASWTVVFQLFEIMTIAVQADGTVCVCLLRYQPTSTRGEN